MRNFLLFYVLCFVFFFLGHVELNFLNITIFITIWSVYPHIYVIGGILTCLTDISFLLEVCLSLREITFKLGLSLHVLGRLEQSLLRTCIARLLQLLALFSTIIQFGVFGAMEVWHALKDEWILTVFKGFLSAFRDKRIIFDGVLSFSGFHLVF